MISTLLIDIDSKIPNLALMKISAIKKRDNGAVGFDIDSPDEVYISCIFKKNKEKAVEMAKHYPVPVDIGGSGVDLSKRLPHDYEMIMPDYSLYTMDYDLGFTSRGCPRKCYFCIVPKKEGKFSVVQHPKEFHDPNHKNVVLLDNNILWDKDWFLEITDWIIANNLKVDFNQGLDIRLMDNDIAHRLKELKPIKIWHFAFDSINYQDDVIRGIEILRNAGVNLRSKTNWYVYLDNDRDFDDAVYRCRLLKEYGTLPYIMINQDAERTQRMTDLKRWCRPQIFFKNDITEYDARVKNEMH